VSLERQLPGVVSPSEEVVVLRDGPVVEVWLNRPARRNATTSSMMRALANALEGVGADARVLVLGGVGSVFCAGRDLVELDPEHDDAEAVLAQTYHPVFARLRALQVPTIAAVHGAALGTGLGLALACDLIVASASCRLGSPFARLGAIPDSGAHLALLAALGRHRAMGVILGGEVRPASDPLMAPLVTTVVADEEFEERVGDLVRRVAAGPTQAFLASRRILDELEAGRREAGLELEAAWQGRLARSRDFAEGMRAFQERRDPRFEGR